jgi:hypothetical protein
MQRRYVLLVLIFDRHETHRRPTNRFADGCSVVGVVLVALDVGPSELRAHQPH